LGGLVTAIPPFAKLLWSLFTILLTIERPTGFGATRCMTCRALLATSRIEVVECGLGASSDLSVRRLRQPVPGIIHLRVLSDDECVLRTRRWFSHSIIMLLCYWLVVDNGLASTVRIAVTNAQCTWVRWPQPRRFSPSPTQSIKHICISPYVANRDRIRGAYTTQGRCKDGSTVEGAGGNTAEGDADNIRAQWLRDGSDAGWSGPTRGTACPADWAILQAQGSVWSSCLNYLLPDKRDSSVTADCAMPRHSNRCQIGQTNFEILSFLIV